MTTNAAANLYLAQHLYKMEGKSEVVYNPHNKPVEELPSIMCFCNSCSREWHEAVAVSEDGVCLGGHICSDHGYIPHDLGILEGCRLDRHEKDYSKHYPDGYKMELIQQSEIPTHEKLQRSIKIARENYNKEAACSGE